MKVALFHNQCVPPRDYGGTERVCVWLCQGLIEAGHEVSLLTPESSQNPGYSPRWEKVSRSISHHNLGESSLEALKRGLPSNVDVLHSMVPLPQEFEHSLGVPVLTTIHGNGKPGEVFSKRSVFVSQDHARRHGSDTFVWNGLDPDEFLFGQTGREGFVFLAKTSWRVKNLRGASRICARAGVALKIAGGSRPWGVRLETGLRPGWQWLGRVSGQKKANLLAGAKALLFPVLWPEPFGLVIAEALFSGTPVIATASGSLPELLGQPGSSEVGALLEWGRDPDREQKWVELLQKVDSGRWKADPLACHAYAMKHFHYQRMTESYLKLYQRLRAGLF